VGSRGPLAELLHSHEQGADDLRVMVWTLIRQLLPGGGVGAVGQVGQDSCHFGECHHDACCSAERTSSAAGPAGPAQSRGKPYCRRGRLQRLVRRPVARTGGRTALAHEQKVGVNGIYLPFFSDKPPAIVRYGPWGSLERARQDPIAPILVRTEKKRRR